MALGGDPAQLTFMLTRQPFERWGDLHADVSRNTLLEFAPQTAMVRGKLTLEKGFFSAWQRGDRVALGEGTVTARTDRIVVQFALPKTTGVLELRVDFDPVPQSVPEVVVQLAERSGWASEGVADPRTELRARDRSFRIPILDEWATGEDSLELLIRHVGIHEAGHHFGFSDDDLHALERAEGARRCSSSSRCRCGAAGGPCSRISTCGLALARRCT